MKRILLFLFAGLFMASPLMTIAQGGEIHWMTMEEALTAQKKNPKKIMMDVFTQWCGPCKMLDKNTFHAPDVVKYVNDNYYAVKFDAESPDAIVFQGQTYSNPEWKPNVKGRNGVHELSRALGVNAYPTVIFLDEDAKVITPVKGYKTPQQLEPYLKFFNEHYHESVTQEEWQTYLGEFKPEFN
jgi:thioredoxin-related protein